MASQGPNNPGTAAQTATGGDVNWSNPNNIKTSGASYATFTVVAVSSTSQLLQGTNFGFSIPGGATINGIVVSLYDSAEGSAADLASLSLLKAGSAAGTPIGATAATGTLTFGSSSSLWGTTWTPAQINDSGFGFEIQAEGTNYYGPAGVVTNAWSITVYYTPSGSTPRASCSPLFGF